MLFSFSKLKLTTIIFFHMYVIGKHYLMYLYIKFSKLNQIIKVNLFYDISV